MPPVKDSDGRSIIRERVSPYLVLEREFKHVVYADKDVHQSEIVEDVGPLGLCLFMDGYIQSAEKDSHIYHESLVQPAMCLVQSSDSSEGQQKPLRVLIGGGGELVTAYEVLKHKSLLQCDMVDIDGKVVDMAKKNLQKFHFDSYQDKRLNLVIGDVHDFVCKKIAGENKEEDKYDVVIMDICDPTEGYGPARLYTKEFYEMCKKVMTPSGVFVTQSTALQTTNYLTAARIRKTAEHVFGRAFLYSSFVPSFVESWGFCIAGGQAFSNLTDANVKSGNFGAMDIDALLQAKNVPCKYYDLETHTGMFCGLGKDLRQKLDSDKIAIATEADKVIFLLADAEEKVEADDSPTSSDATASP